MVCTLNKSLLGGNNTRNVVQLNFFSFSSQCCKFRSHFCSSVTRLWLLINPNFFSGVLSLILSGPCGLTCDRFHITQLQRSLGDQFLPVRGMHWFRDLSWRDTFVFGERDWWRCGRVVLMRICRCQWCISGHLLFDVRSCIFGGSGWFPPLWWCITAARTVNFLLHWRCVCLHRKKNKN